MFGRILGICIGKVLLGEKFVNGWGVHMVDIGFEGEYSWNGLNMRKTRDASVWIKRFMLQKL